MDEDYFEQEVVQKNFTIKDGFVQESEKNEFGNSDEDELFCQIKDDDINQIISNPLQTKPIISPNKYQIKNVVQNFQTSSNSSTSAMIPSSPILTNIITESPPSPCPTLCLNTSREAFFASWENDEITLYEKRVQTLKRRFPGPAGLLPLITPKESELLSDSEHPFTLQISKIISSDIHFHRQQAQSSASDLSPDMAILRINKAPWRELIKVLKINPNDPKSLFSLMNIRWIKRTLVKHPVTTKIPFLALVVQEDPGLLGSKQKRDRVMNPNIKLMDSTGSIDATMDAKFIEKYGSDLASGTSFAVKNIGFLSFRRQVILTITTNNIICMTSMIKSETSPLKKIESSAAIDSTFTSLHENEIQPYIKETKEGVKIITFCEFSHTKAFQKYETILNTVLYDQEDSLEDRLFDSGVQEPKRRISEAGPFIVELSVPRPSPQANVSLDFDVFGNDADDDALIMNALENVDFLMENDKITPTFKS